VFFLFHQDTLPYLAQKYHKELGFKYTKIEGTLFFGFRVQDFEYDKLFKAKKLELQYDLISLISPFHSIDTLIIEDASLDLSHLDQSPQTTKEREQNFSFLLKQGRIKNLEISNKEYEANVDLEMETFRYSQDIDLQHFFVDLSSKYGNLEARGDIKSSKIFAKTAIETASLPLKKSFESLLIPQTIVLDLSIDKKSVQVSSVLEDISLQENTQLSLDKTLLDANYSLTTQQLEFKAEIDAHYGEKYFSIKNSGSLEHNQSYTLTSIVDDKITLIAKGDRNRLEASMVEGENSLRVSTTDYKRFEYSLKSIYLLSKGAFEIREDQFFFDATLVPHTFIQTKLQKLELQESLFDQTQVHADYKNNTISLQLKNKNLDLHLQKKEKKLQGDGFFLDNPFHIDADLNNSIFTIEMKIDSLSHIVPRISTKPLMPELTFELPLHIETQIDLDQVLKIQSKMVIPHYRFKYANKEFQSKKEQKFELLFENDELSLLAYDFYIDDIHIFSTKRSKLFFQKDTIVLDTFYVNDSLELKGEVSLEKKLADLSIVSQNYQYQSQDINLSLQADLDAILYFDGRQKVRGKVQLLDANVSYMPQNEYVISDPDIIILQELEKKQQQSQRDLNITIEAKKAIHYKHKEIEIFAKPQLRVIQKPLQELQIFGVVKIEKGEILLSDRSFVFDPSEVYFNAEIPLNPQLNLNLHHYTLDDIDILISITNTMADPVIVLSSNPTMSQEDILSYILFGESAEAVFDTSADNSSISLLMLGSGLKNLFNQSKFVHIDTLNLLNNAEGSLGYEIGARVDKNMRIVYKNDTISTLVIQYKLAPNLRLDIDVDETGQGVNILYIKEFQ